jgi:hypothetical protein
MIDKRLLKVEFDHAQSRVKRPRVGFSLRGLEFMDGVLEGTWVNPVSGKIQPIPNSEEAEFQTLNTGRFAKWRLGDGTTYDGNSPVGIFKMSEAMGMHKESAIKYTGTNGNGIGFKTIASRPANEGMTLLVYAFSSGTDTDAILVDAGFGNTMNYLDGVSIRIFLDGRVMIYREGVKVGQGSVSGGGYNPGTVRGASYERASNEFVMVRIEAAQGRYILITTSRGGTFQFSCPWTVERRSEGGTVVVAAEPALPSAQRWWYIPKGGATVVAAPVIYGYSSPYAISPPYKFQEVPTFTGGSTDVLSARVLPSGPVSISLVMEDGVTPYNRVSDTFRVRLDFSGAHFVNGVTGGFPRIFANTPVPEGGPVDVSDWLLSCSLALDDGPQGLSAEISLRGDAPVDLLTEGELRPIRISLVANPDDESAPAALVLLDGVGSAPDWEDGLEPEQTEVKFKVSDRMALVREAQLSECVPFDGLPLCRPVEDGESIVSIAFREGGLTNVELSDLPEILDSTGTLYRIEDTPSQRAGEWNFAGNVGDLWSDVLERAFAFAPEVLWGLRPTPAGTRAYAIDPQDSDPILARLYRTPEEAAADPHYEESELGAWPLLYGPPHSRAKLPREANLVRVTGYDPTADKGLQAFISDNASRNPQSPLDPNKLGVTRQFSYSDPALTSQKMVDELTRKVWAAVSKRVYLHSWVSFLRFRADGSPLWRGEKVRLKASSPDGEDEDLRISAFTLDLLDESGRGTMDEDGSYAPIPIRVAQYSGGSVVGLGGSTFWEIRKRQREQVSNGGLRRTGFGRIPPTSMGEVQALPLP